MRQFYKLKNTMLCMEIFLEKENKVLNIELSKPKTLKGILNDLEVIIESVILVKNDEVCLEDVTITNSDKVKILSVVSGG